MKDERIKVLYILGGGHSGSTVLSLIIGAAPEVFNAGELKFYSRHSDRNFFRWKEVENRCTCGEEADSCPFWAEVEKTSPDLEIRYQPGICAYLGTIISGSRSYSLDDLVLFKNILQIAAIQFPSTKIILDTSKSLPRYLQLCANPGIDVTAIFLVRDGRGYLNSYRKRHQARSFFWLLQWAGVNLFALLHLATRKDHFYWLSYDRFTREPDKYLKEINQLFSIRIPSNYSDAVNQTPHHVRAGNVKVLAEDEFAGLVQDDSWKTELPKATRWIVNLLVPPLNRLFKV